MTAKKNKGLADELLDDLMEEVKSSPSSALDLFDKSEEKPSSRTPSPKVPTTIDPYRSRVEKSAKDLHELSFGTIKKVPDTEPIEIEPRKMNPAKKNSSFSSEPEARKDLDSKTIPIDNKIANEARIPDEIPQLQPKSKMASTGGLVGLTEKALAHSENLRLAQSRIVELEKHIESLRSENEQLVVAGDTLKKRADELRSRSEDSEQRLKDVEDRLKEENSYLRDSLTSKTEELNSTREKLDELEGRLQAAVQKVRLRERELENRLEILKVENSALMNNKNNIILDLKRNVDQLNSELESYRNRGQQLNKQLDDNKDTLRRTVKTLRLALNMLEGGIDKAAGGKKGES